MASCFILVPFKEETVKEQANETIKEQDAAEGKGAVPEEIPGASAQEEDLPSQLARAREEAKDLEDRMLRLAAEFENFKKRMQRERELAMKYAEEGLLRDLLPSIDNLERAIEEGRKSSDIGPLLEGVEMTLKGLLNTLEKYGLECVECHGKPFDPNLHEALAMEESEEHDANVVMQEYMKGYKFKDRLLRPAKVVVSSGRKESSGANEN